MRGWVYIAENESLVDMVKIGFSDLDPAIRMGGLSNTSIPTPFKVIYEVLIDSPYEVEQLLHQYFSDDRVSNDREFFRTAPQEIVKRLRQIAEKMDLTIHLENSNFQEIDYTFPCTLKHLKQQRVEFIDKVKKDIKTLKKIVRKSRTRDQDEIIEKWVDREIGLEKLVCTIISDDFLLTQLLPLNKRFHSVEALNEFIYETFWSRCYAAFSWIGELSRSHNKTNTSKQLEHSGWCSKCNFSGSSKDFQIKKNLFGHRYFACPRCTYWNSYV